MNRVRRICYLGLFRVPRTCGDEPVTIGYRYYMGMCSPHLRG